MAVEYNPSVVTDGLVMYLDASNPKSYNPNLVTVVGASNCPFNGEVASVSLDTTPVGTTELCKHTLTGLVSPFMNVRVDRSLNAGTYTMSAWVRATTSFSASFAYVGETTNEIYANTAAITPTWTRFTLTFTLIATQTNSRLQIFFGTQGNDKIISVWGCELLKGPSPTAYYIDSNYRGTTWQDLTGNGYDATVSNTYFISTESGGTLETQGVVGSYILQSTLNLAATNNTIITATRYAAASPRGRMLNGRSNNWLLGNWNGTTENYYAEGWVSAIGAGTGDTTWRIMAGTGQIAADAYSVYVNGTNTVLNSVSGSAGPNGFVVGTTGYSLGSELTLGRCSFVMAYNRVLNNVELQKNFNALRGRFGI
jgi:hypothetical protein